MAYILQRVVRKPSGAMLYTHLDGVGDSNEDTVQCVHCDAHWVIQPGSGKQRGFCMNCGGVTCGKELCETQCRPREQLIEEIEAAGERRRQLELNLREIRGA